MRVPHKASVCTVHGRLSIRRENRLEHMDLVAAPAVLEGTKAEDLMSAVTSRLPVTVEWLKSKCQGRVFVVMSSDSGPSCLKLGRHLDCVQAVCRMHQHCLSMTLPLKIAGAMSPLFCSSLLMRRRRVQKSTRMRMRAYVDKYLECIFDPPDPANSSHVSSILDMMERLLSSRLVEVSEPSKRLSQLARPKTFLCGVRGQRLVHYCPVGGEIWKKYVIC